MHRKPISDFIFIITCLTTFTGTVLNAQDTVKYEFDICETTIAIVHQALRNNEITCEDLVEKYIERIVKYDSDINSIITLNPEALQAARLLDEEFKKTGTLRPLHGVPFIIKDNFNTAGLQTTGGSILLKGFEPAENAFVIMKIINAGGIILAKSNMSEWAIDATRTISSVVGETRNPYNSDYVSGGSTGGTAVALACNLGLAGMGTDTGSSINGPASHASIVGLRPSLGLVSRSGTIPLYSSHDIPGPMARTVEDIARILNVIAGEDKKDPVTNHSKGRIPESYIPNIDTMTLENIRIGVLEILISRLKDPEIRSLFNQALKDMEEMGAEIVHINIPEFDRIRSKLWCKDFQYSLNRYLRNQKKNVPLKNYSELIKSGKFLDSNKEFLEEHRLYDEDTVTMNNMCPNVFKSLRRSDFRRIVEKTMDMNQIDLIVYPSWLISPVRIGTTNVFASANSPVIAPLTGQPSMTVPMGFGTNNLPSGIQFLGRIFDEERLLKVAYIYEQRTQHRKAPDLETFR